MNKLKDKPKIDFFVISESTLWSKKLAKVRNITKKILVNHDYFINKKFTQYDIIILLSDNKRIKKLNKKFKNVKKPTDILTFINSYKYKKTNVKVCNIVLSAEIIFKDAKKMKKFFYDHVTHLIIHSLLHSNGYNHNTLLQNKKMKKIEIELLKKLKIDNPYLE